MRVTCCKTFAAISALLLSVGIASAAEVTLISVGGVKGALDKIVADYKKETGNDVKFTVGSPLVVSKKLADGEAFDVVVQSVPAMDDYAKLGGLKADTRVKVARGGIGMAVGKEATPPDISTPDKFKTALMDGEVDRDNIGRDAQWQWRPDREHPHQGRRDGCDQAEAQGRRARSRSGADRQGRDRNGLLQYQRDPPVREIRRGRTGAAAAVHQLRCRGDGEIDRRRGGDSARPDDCERGLGGALEIGRHGAGALRALTAPTSPG